MEILTFPLRGLRRFWWGMLATACVVLGVVLALPHDPAVPFHLLRTTDYIKAGWIYDRIVISNVPIDVALIGTSHMLNAADSGMLEDGLSKAAGARVHVANLALPSLGDDLHDLFVTMLLAHKRPRLIVVELQQVPARAAHPAYRLLAPFWDVVGEPLGNPAYFDDVLQLPHRQLRYFADSLGAAPAGAVADHWDDTYQVIRHDGLLAAPRLGPPPDGLVQDAARDRALLNAKAAEYARLGWLTFRYNDWYLRHFLNAARDRGVRVVLLYLPVFGTTAPPAGADWLGVYGPIVTPPAALLSDPLLWHDTEHVNFAGARVVSDWLVGVLAHPTPPGPGANRR